MRSGVRTAEIGHSSRPVEAASEWDQAFACVAESRQWKLEHQIAFRAAFPALSQSADNTPDGEDTGGAAAERNIRSEGYTSDEGIWQITFFSPLR